MGQACRKWAEKDNSPAVAEQFQEKWGSGFPPENATNEKLEHIQFPEKPNVL
jgi:hypothetical protein